MSQLSTEQVNALNEFSRTHPHLAKVFDYTDSGTKEGLGDALNDIAGSSDHGDLTGLLDDDHPQYILVDGTRAFTGDQSLGGNRLTNLGAPVAGTDAARFQDVVNDHGALTGLSDDDHTQYALLAGRVGGQVLTGSPSSEQSITIRGSSGVDPGRVLLGSPISVTTGFPGGGLAASNAAFLWEPSFTITNALDGIQRGINISPIIGIQYNNFIYSAVETVQVLNQQVAPAFSAFNLFNVQGRNVTASTSFRPMNAQIVNAAHRIRIDGAGGACPDVTNHFGLNFFPILEAYTAGDSIRVVNTTAVRCIPSFATRNATASVNMGTIRGLHCLNPAVVPLDTQIGTETMDAYYGLDFDNITFDSTKQRAAVRSALVAGTTNFFLLDTGGAQSRLIGSLGFGSTSQTSLIYSGTTLALETRGRLRIQEGHLALNESTPTILGASQNNYALPSGTSQRVVHRLSASTPVNITGIAVQLTRDAVTLVNIGANTITLIHESASSTATNRFTLPGAVDLALGSGASVIIWHDTTSDRWRVLARSD